VRKTYRLTLAGSNVTPYILSYSFSFNINFGIATLSVELVNNNGIFSSGGANEIYLGDSVVLVEGFFGTSDTFTNFTGYVRQRRKTKSGGANIMSITCLDYLVKLEDTDVEERFEATKISVTDETLTPNYLGAAGEANDHLAQVFDFANEALALDPPPSIGIYDKYSEITFPQDSGYQLNHETGQIVFGSAFNAYDSYDVKASYSYYPKGFYIEDIIEELITAEDGYSNFLFGETSAQAVIDNHLTETLYSMKGWGGSDTLTPNYSSQNITISTTLESAVSAGDTSVTVDDTNGFSDSGSGNINGDDFTWTGKTATTLTGIPATGGNALRAHAADSYVNYKTSYAAGTIWYLSFSNLITTLTSADFTIPAGSTINYVDKRFGRIILDSAISILSVLTCNTNYSLKTLQSTGIETPSIDFTFQKTKNRLEALKNLRELLAPNYVLRTVGSDKIWGEYLSQKRKEDHTLKCKASLDYAEDSSIYTRTKFFGENENPTNVCWQPNLAFLATGETYTATATDTELAWDRSEGAWQVYSTGLPESSVVTSTFQPRVRVNGVLINDQLNQIVMQPVTVEYWGLGEIGGRPKYRFRVHFAWTGIDRSHNILCYNAVGVLTKTIVAGNAYMNYEQGVLESGPVDENDPWRTWLTLSTASFWVHWSRQYLQVDWAKAEFKINKLLIPDAQIAKVKVTADFEYKTVIEGIRNGEYIIDGRWDSQAQSVFYQKPASGFIYFKCDLGATYRIDAVDLTHGFYKPDAEQNPNRPGVRRKFDITNVYTLQYSTDNVTYHNVAKEAVRFRLSGGESKSFERDVLGDSFEVRYFQLVINDMTEIPYGEGVYVAAFTEFAVYTDIVLQGEAKLTPYTELSTTALLGDTIVYVDDTTGFDASGTAYINDDPFTYTGKTATTFTGCSGVEAHAIDTRVSQEIAREGASSFLTSAASDGDAVINVKDALDFATLGTAYIKGEAFTYTGTTETSLTGCSGVTAHPISEEVYQEPTVYDVASLLGRLGDKLKKNTDVNPYLSTRNKIFKRARDFLYEYQKNHSRVSISVPFSPHIKIGTTLLAVDATNNISNRFFVESIQNNSGSLNLMLASYPG